MQVDFPLVLDLAPYKESNGAADNYDLRGLVEHQGSQLKSGHYVAYLMEGTCWRCCNDDKITTVRCCTQTSCSKQTFRHLHHLNMASLVRLHCRNQSLFGT